MTNPGTGTGPRLVKGLDPVPKGQCPRCVSKRVLGPRIVRDEEEWCHCYNCGHEWQTNKPGRVYVLKGRKPRKPKKEPKPKWI